MTSRPCGSGEPAKQDEMLAIYNSLGWFLGIFAILVGGIVMTNVMVMSVFERTQEIGVLRACGWRRRRVLRMVLVESLALSGLSGVAGTLIGLGLNALFGLEPTYGRLLPTAYTAANVVEIIVLVLLLGAIGGLYPAWRAANLRPVEARRRGIVARMSCWSWWAWHSEPISCRTSSRAVSASAWRSPAPWRIVQQLSWPTSQPATWTRRTPPTLWDCWSILILDRARRC